MNSNKKQLKKVISIYILFFVFICVNSIYGFSEENNNIKSLKQKLKKVSDSEKSMILNELAKAYWWDNDKKNALNYGEAALKYSKKFNQEREKLYALISISHANRRMKNFKLAEKTIKKAHKLAKSRNIKQEILDVLITFEKIYEFNRKIPDWKKIVKFCLKIVSLSNALDDHKNEALYNHILGGVYKRLINDQESLKFYKRALELYKTTNNLEGEVHILTYLGSFKRNLQKYDEAFESLKKAEIIALENNLKEKLCRVYSAFGSLFYSQSKFDKALKYYLKENVIAKEINNSHWMFGSIVYLIDLHLLKGVYNSKILDYTKAGIEILKKNNYLKTRDYYNVFLLNLAKIDYLNKRFILAYGQYQTSIVYAKKNKNMDILFRTYLNLALYQLENQNIKKAKKILKKCKGLVKRIKNLYFRRLYFDSLKKIHSN